MNKPEIESITIHSDNEEKVIIEEPLSLPIIGKVFQYSEPLYISEPDFSFDKYTQGFKATSNFILLALTGEWYARIYNEVQEKENKPKTLREYFDNEFSLNKMTFEEMTFNSLFLIFENCTGFENSEKLKEKFPEMIFKSPS